MGRKRNWKPRKVVVVGAVGSTFAYALAQAGLADEIALLDKDRRFAEGQVLDLSHGLVSESGVERVVETNLSGRERVALPRSAAVLKQSIHDLEQDHQV